VPKKALDIDLPGLTLIRVTKRRGRLFGTASERIEAGGVLLAELSIINAISV